MSRERRCFYDVLNLRRNCEHDDVRKAYRKLAIKWHPDKNPGNEEQAAAMFQEVALAYEVLSDPDKRQLYDAYGHEGLEASAAGGDAAGGFGADPFSGGVGMDFASHIFETFFGGGDPFTSGFGAFDEDDLMGMGTDPFAGMGIGRGPGSSGRSEGRRSGRRRSRQQRSQDEEEYYAPRAAPPAGAGGRGRGGGRRDPFQRQNPFGAMDDMLSQMMGAGFAGSGGDDDFGFGGGGHSSSRGGSTLDSMMAEMGRQGMGGGSSSSSFFSSSSSSSFGGGGGRSVSRSTQVRIGPDGRKVTVTTQTVRNPDGTSETTTHESVEDGPPPGMRLEGGGGGGHGRSSRSRRGSDRGESGRLGYF